MAISGTVAILRGISRGAPIVIVGGYRKSLDWALLGAKELKRVNELKGKKVGVTAAGSMSEFLVIEALKTKGLIRDQDYTILPAGQELLRVLGLKSGNLQAIPLSGGQKVLLESEGYPILMELRSVFPNLPTSVVLGTKKFVATNPNKVVGVLKALSKAADLIRKDKDRAIQMGKAQRLPGDATVERKALDHYWKDLQVGLRKEDLAAFMKLLGIKEPVEDFFEESHLAGAITSR
jgi:NitT/TauT family transport system substrate-binding protein